MMFPELLEQPQGFLHIKGMLDRATQEEFVSEVRRVVARAPFFRPVMPRYGSAFKLQLTNCGELGWVSDINGFRYQPTHPDTKAAWPEMPESFRHLAEAAARRVGHNSFRAESCLINYYADPSQSLGLHRDETEEDHDAPIISVSLGDIGRFGLGGLTRTAPVEEHLVESGDVMVMGLSARMRYHSFAGLIPGTSDLLKRGGRINLTIRQVRRSQPTSQH